LASATPRAQQLVREAVDDERPGASHNERAIDDVAQLAHIARPVVLLQRLDEVRLDIVDFLLFCLIQLLQKEVREERNVLESLSKRRDLDRENVQAVVEI